MALGILPVALLVPALAASVKTLFEKWRARNDLSVAIARSGPEETQQLRAMVEADDLPGVLATIRAHMGELPVSEQKQAEIALSQVSESGRRSYAQSVVAPGLRQAAG